jgi:cardiolipin synthase
MQRNLPNILTLSRILVIPLLIGAFYINGDLGNWVVLALFVLASVTDFLDGYLARTWKQVSEIGRFLDPVADKLLVASTLLMLVAFDRIEGWTILPALVILCREILVSGLREFLASIRMSVPVSRRAKWKTAIQMTAIGFLIVGNAGPAALPILTIGEIGLWIAALFTLTTGYAYMRVGIQRMYDPAEPRQTDPGEPDSP